MAKKAANTGSGDADSSDYKNLSRYLADTAKSAQTLKGVLAAIKADGKNLVDQHRDISENAQQSTKAFTELNRVMRSSIANSNEYLASQLNANVAVRELSKNRREILKLAEGTSVASKYANNLLEEELGLLETQAEIYGYEGELAKFVAQQLKNGLTIQEIQNQKQFEALEAYQESISFRKKDQELQLKVKERAEEILKSHNKLKDTIKQELMFMKEMANNPKLLGAVLAEQVAEKGKEIVHSFHEMDKSGLAVGQRVEAMRKGFSLMSMIGLSDTKGVIEGMVESYGTLNAMTDTQVDHVGHLAKEMGVSGQEAFALVDAFSKMPGETMESAVATADYANNLAKANGLAPGKLTKDMAKNTEAMALFSAKGAKGFADGAVELHKMGVEIGTASKMAQGLLNFEDSINKQLEASVLLGKEINLDKARELALNGDLEGSTKEVLKNIGGAAAFDKMNVLQKQKLAEATGMSVEELQKAVDAQAEYNKYFGQQASAFDKAAGYTMEFGSATLGFFKENAVAIMASLQLVTTLGNTKLGMFLRDKAQAVWERATSAFRSADKTREIAQENALATAKQRTAAAEKMKGAGGSLGGSTGAVSSINVGNLLKGAAAMAIAAGAIYIFAKAVQEFDKIENWGAVAAGLGAFLATMALAGYILSFATPAIYAAAPALLAFGGAVLLFGAGIGIAAAGLSLLVTSLKDVPFENLAILPMALMGIGAGLGVMAVAGLAALPIIAALTALAVVAPALVGLGVAMGGMFGGGGEEGDKMDELIGKIDTLIAVASAGKDINLDSKKIGEAMNLGGFNQTRIR